MITHQGARGAIGVLATVVLLSTTGMGNVKAATATIVIGQQSEEGTLDPALVVSATGYNAHSAPFG